MSLILFKRPTMLALAGVVTLMSLIPTAEAQYRRPYGYNTRRRGGWWVFSGPVLSSFRNADLARRFFYLGSTWNRRNIYLLAIFFAVILLFWMFVFRKLLARRRNRQADVLPSHTSSTTYPQTGDYSSNPYTGGNAGYDNNTYNYGQQQTTQYPQQAHVSTGQQQYAPPPGKPPQGY
jgi:hypothetical protein